MDIKRKKDDAKKKSTNLKIAKNPSSSNARRHANSFGKDINS